MEARPRILQKTPLEVADTARDAERPRGGAAPRRTAEPRAALLSRVVEHYHRTFCEREDAQAVPDVKRGLTDVDLLKALKVGYADGSLLKTIPKAGELREQLVELGRHHRRRAGSCWAAASWCRSRIPSRVSGRASTAGA